MAFSTVCPRDSGCQEMDRSGSPLLSQRGRVGDKNNSHLQNPRNLKQACAKWHTDARVNVRKLHVSVSGYELI